MHSSIACELDNCWRLARKAARGGRPWNRAPWSRVPLPLELVPLPQLLLNCLIA